MVDTAFDDFLDSDDDAFLLEASHQCFDYYSATESTQTPERAASQNQTKTSTSLCLKSNDSTISRGTENVSNTKKISSKECEVTVNNVNSSTTLLKSNTDNVSDYSKMTAKECENTNKSIIKESRILSESYSNTASTSAEYTSVNNLNKHPITPDISSYINSRFTPGFTPKAKKRKLPGPAGLIKQFNGSQEAVAGSSEEMLDMEFKNIVSSQFTPEHLSLISWQKLQTTVSSCPNLHSTVKYYSIKGVLQESSKKKLPKHMVVPVLCVLLKKRCYRGSLTKSVFMDDTGEINGKIDAEVLSMYKEYLVEGTALILKKVTFLCNVLILKAQNLVSMYHPEGMEKHPQTLDSILETPESLNCESLKTSHHDTKGDRHEIPFYSNSHDNHKSGCISHSQSRLHNNSERNKTLSNIPHYNKTPESHTSSYVGYNQNRFNTVSNQNTAVNKNISHLSSERSSCASEVSSQNKIMRSDAFLENLLDEDNCTDEFDELLGNLDEKSFMEDF